MLQLFCQITTTSQKACFVVHISVLTRPCQIHPWPCQAWLCCHRCPPLTSASAWHRCEMSENGQLLASRKGDWKQKVSLQTDCKPWTMYSAKMIVCVPAGDELAIRLNYSRWNHLINARNNIAMITVRNSAAATSKLNLPREIYWCSSTSDVLPVVVVFRPVTQHLQQSLENVGNSSRFSLQCKHFSTTVVI